MDDPAAQRGCVARRGRTATEAYLNGTSQGAARTATQRGATISSRPLAGGYGVGVTPVPFPNTAVKPHRADGTAGLSGGRVRRRQPYIRPPRASRLGGLLYSNSLSSPHARLLFHPPRMSHFQPALTPTPTRRARWRRTLFRIVCWRCRKAGTKRLRGR